MNNAKCDVLIGMGDLALATTSTLLFAKESKKENASSVPWAYKKLT